MFLCMCVKNVKAIRMTCYEFCYTAIRVSLVSTLKSIQAYATFFQGEDEYNALLRELEDSFKVNSLTTPQTHHSSDSLV